MPRIPVDRLEGGGGTTPPATQPGVYADGSWDYWVFDDATGTWSVTKQPGPAPAFRWGVGIVDGQQIVHQVPVAGWTPGTGTVGGTGFETDISMTRSESIASHYATVGGHDIYVETEAEMAARSSGLQRDENGYFRLIGGKKVYQTGMDPATGQRWHLDPTGAKDPFTGEVVKVYDDQAFQPLYGTRDDLIRQQQEAQNTLLQLRNQYKDGRGDSWTVKQNLLVRIRDTEDKIESINRALGKDPIPEPVNKISGTNETKFQGGVQVHMDFAVMVEGQDLSFANPMLDAPIGSTVVARATVDFSPLGGRKWLPGMLQQPDMCRVEWTIPAQYTSIDGAPLSTDEFVYGGSIQVMRTFLSPAEGNTWTGKGTDLVFSVKASLYEIVLDDTKTPLHWHREGDDGYQGGVIQLPGDGSVPPDQLAKFLVGLGWVESRNHPDSEQHHPPYAYGEWQITAHNWDNWSKTARGHILDKTPENSQYLTVWRVSQLYVNAGNYSWRKVCIAWKTGPNGLRKLINQYGDKVGSTVGSPEFIRVKSMIDKSGLPWD